MDVIAISNNLYEKTGIFSKRGFEFILKREDLTYSNLNKIKPNYIFFPHWSYIIPPNIYKNFNCIIFHMTDLPFGRGGSPLQNLISRGIYKTKISAIKCCETLDGGDVYLKKDFDISRGNAQTLYKKAGILISKMIDEISGTKPIPTLQKGRIVNFKRRTPEMSNIKNLSDINKIYDYIRMLDCEGYPTAYLENKGVKYSFKNAKIKNGKIFAQVEIEVNND